MFTKQLPQFIYNILIIASERDNAKCIIGRVSYRKRRWYVSFASDRTKFNKYLICIFGTMPVKVIHICGVLRKKAAVTVAYRIENEVKRSEVSIA